mgnify:CR=1 FL=1
MMHAHAMTANWHYPTEVFFEIDGFRHLPQRIQSLSAKRVLWVVDTFLESEPVVQDMLKALQQASIAVSVFSAFSSNPNSDQVEAGRQAYLAHQADAVIAMGGGSALDIGKTIALVAEQSRSVWDFVDEDDNYLRADASRIRPIIAIPTTAGTGSEVGRAALITNPLTHEKKIIFHPKMLPSAVLCDPSLTVTLPPGLTAATGMDALAHNLEALCSPSYHPMADGIAMEGLRLICDYLPRAFENGHDLEARSGMMTASLMGATAFQSGLGAVHALSHPVGGLYDAHHGLLNAIFMPYVLYFNRPQVEQKMVRLARYLDLSAPTFEAVLAWVQALNQRLELPTTLTEIGIDHHQAAVIAERAMADPSASSNPRELTAFDCKQLFLAAVSGEWQHLQSA